MQVFSSCGEQGLLFMEWGDFSPQWFLFCGAQALGVGAPVVEALELQLLWLPGLVAPRFVESLQTRD